jgi:hypothetical protein
MERFAAVVLIDLPPARSWTNGPWSEPCSTVARVGAGRKDPPIARPSRRWRARTLGRTKRATGRAAYFAAMLCSMGSNGTPSEGRCKRRSEPFRSLWCQRATRLSQTDLALCRSPVER